MLSKSFLFNLPDSPGTSYFKFLLVYHQGNSSFPQHLQNPLSLLLLTARALIWPFNFFCTVTTATSCLLCPFPSLSAHCSCPRLLAQQRSGTSARLLPSVHPIQLSHLEFSSLHAVPCFNILLHSHMFCCLCISHSSKCFHLFPLSPCFSYDASLT